MTPARSPSRRTRSRRGLRVGLAGFAVTFVAACTASEDPAPAASPPATAASPGPILEAEPERRPTPTALGEIVAAYPLTGQPVDDGHDPSRPALAVKIDNAPSALPQAGLEDADVVFEERVEGGLTRLLAVFHSRDAAEVGPVRSARSTDLPLLSTLGVPLFAWSGANAQFAELVRASNVIDVGIEAAFGAYESRDDERPRPSHLFSSTSALYDAGDGRGEPPRELWRFAEPGAALASSARPITGVALDYGVTTVVFRWDAEAGGWARTQDGVAHVGADGEVLTPTNVVVRFVEYEDSGSVDANGVPVPEAVLAGAGDAWFLVDGHLVEGRWDQRTPSLPAEYLTLEGSFAELDPGSTWVVLPEVGGPAEGTVVVLGGR